MDVDIDLAACQTALRQATVRTTALLHAVNDPSEPVPGLTWNVAETAAHLLGDIQHYTGFVTGDRDPRGYLEKATGADGPSERSVIGNALLLEEVPERDVPTLAAGMIPAVEAFIAASERRSPEEGFLTATGLTMTVPMATAALLGEQVIHGLDLARAVKTPWPIRRTDALLMVAVAMALVPEYVDKEKTAGMHVAYELRFRGGPRYRLVIDDGTAVVTAAGRRIDCWIAADPVAFVLVGYGRVGQWGQALRGRIISGGRKPWLGLKFGELLTSV